MSIYHNGSKELRLAHVMELLKNHHQADHLDFSRIPEFFQTQSTKIPVTCSKHGEFMIRTSCLLRNRGCPKCGSEKAAKTAVKGARYFIEKARKIHNDKYDYSRVEGNWKNYYIKVEIVCPEHGPFLMSMDGHVNGERNCPNCFRSTASLDIRLKLAIEKAKSVHGDKYDYSRVHEDFKSVTDKVWIGCPEHGWFKQDFAKHNNQGCGCPQCSESHMEKELHRKLEAKGLILGVDFFREQEFSGLLSTKGFPLRFDFWVPKWNTLIECDGRQHREWVKGMMTKSDFIRLQAHDKLKNAFCEENGIKLIRLTKENF